MQTSNPKPNISSSGQGPPRVTPPPPNELHININTSIPGFQRLTYNPSMTIKNTDKADHKVMFYPLIKLNQQTVNSVPKDLRQKQFFNRGLFDSLLNFTKSTPANTLKQATAMGFVDNNIKVTLDTLFPENSVLYVGGKPYVIYDVQWTAGSWNIDTKKKREILDSSKITDPLLYQAVVNDEIISGEQQLEELNGSLAYGPNYTGPKNPKVKEVDTETETESQLPDAGTGTGTGTGTSSEPTPPLQIEDAPEYKPKPPLPQIEDIPERRNGPLPQIEDVPSTPSSNSSVDEIKPEPEPEPEPEPDSTAEIVSEDKPNIIKPKAVPFVIEPSNKMNTSLVSTRHFRQIISSKNFYFLLNSLYQGFPAQEQNNVNNILKNTTDVDVKKDNKTISVSAYARMINNVRIVTNVGQGNCFFIAVADAINEYNYYNQSSRIISGIYGTGEHIFTQAYLRSLVFDFMMSLSSNTKQNQREVSAFFANELNDIFEHQLRDYTNEHPGAEPDPSLYVDWANNIYRSHPNFLVKPVTGVPVIVDEYSRPFKVLENAEIRDYIMSNNYWADNVAIDALSDRLRLNVIPIQINGGTISIEGGNFNTKYNMWNKYLFLYYSHAHYELITFKYIERVENKDEFGEVKGIKKVIKTKTIFDRKPSLYEYPPLYIYLIVYGSSYSTIKEDPAKQSFTFYRQIMQMFDNSLTTYLQKQLKYPLFYRAFKSYFPHSRIAKPVSDSRSDSGSVTSSQSGGYYMRTNPFMPAYKLMKPGEVNSISQLAYYITIDLELHPGTTIPPDEINTLRCRQRWNAVRKAWSSFTGKPYIIPPVYQYKKIDYKSNTKKQPPTETKVGGKRRTRKRRLR